MKGKVAPLTVVLNDPQWEYVLYIPTILGSAGLEILVPKGGECARRPGKLPDELQALVAASEL